MSEKVAEERAEELGWLWKVKVNLVFFIFEREDIER